MTRRATWSLRRSGYAWTQAEDRLLVHLVERGRTRRELAAALERSVRGITIRAEELGLTLPTVQQAVNLRENDYSDWSTDALRGLRTLMAGLRWIAEHQEGGVVRYRGQEITVGQALSNLLASINHRSAARLEVAS